MSSNEPVSYLMVPRNALFFMQSTWEMLGMVLWHLISNALIRRCNSSVCVQDSYRKHENANTGSSFIFDFKQLFLSFEMYS